MRLIGRPVSEMTGLMLKLAGGDTDIALERYNRRDEIGAMARAVEVFRDAADENRRLEAETASVRRTQEEERERQTAIDSARAEGLRGFVDAVQHCFTELSEGDLTIRMNDAVAPEFEPIRDKFNDTVAALEDAVGSVVASIGNITSSGLPLIRARLKTMMLMTKIATRLWSTRTAIKRCMHPLLTLLNP